MSVLEAENPSNTNITVNRYFQRLSAILRIPAIFRNEEQTRIVTSPCATSVPQALGTYRNGNCKSALRTWRGEIATDGGSSTK